MYPVVNVFPIITIFYVYISNTPHCETSKRIQIHVISISGVDLILYGYGRHSNKISIDTFLRMNEESEYKVLKYIYIIFDKTYHYFILFTVQVQKLVTSETPLILFVPVHCFGIPSLILSYPLTLFLIILLLSSLGQVASFSVFFSCFSFICCGFLSFYNLVIVSACN